MLTSRMTLRLRRSEIDVAYLSNEVCSVQEVHFPSAHAALCSQQMALLALRMRQKMPMGPLGGLHRGKKGRCGWHERQQSAHGALW